ncbi:MAG: Flp family type IVb pilin [Phycisphaerales bacterium]|nr:MAG: Flp family type IVb pilin [Phycisphaerales bacterium]
MNGWLQRLPQLLRSEDGPTATEYGVMLALIALTVLGTMSMFGQHVNNLWTMVATSVDVF